MKQIEKERGEGGGKKRSGTVSHFSASVTDILIANVRKIFLSILFQFMLLRIPIIQYINIIL